MKKLALAAGVAVSLWLAYAWLGDAVPASDARTSNDRAAPPVPALTRTDDAPTAPVAASPPARESVAAAPVPADPDTGALAVHVVDVDGQPVPGVAVAFMAMREGLPPESVERVVADADGQARAEGLRPGSVRAFTDRGGYAQADVVAGETAEARLELPADSVAVGGIVVDERGAAVAGASVWLTTGYFDWLGGNVVARTDAAGEFRIERVPEDSSVGAFAPGFAPSELVDLGTVDRSRPVRVELVLSGAGGAVAGRVLAPDGQPLEGARVALGEALASFASSVGRNRIEAWTPRAVETDTVGDFRFEGVAPGETTLAVHVRGLPRYRATVVVEPGSTTRHDVLLEAGAAVEGVVTGADGEPVAGATIRGFVEPVPEVFLQLGQFDHTGAFGYPAAIAGDAGRFRLEPLPPGELYLYATSPRFDAGAIQSVVLNDTLELHAAPGSTHTWNPILSEGRVIRGRAAYADGAPMEGVFVLRRDEMTAELQVTMTDTDGRFRFVNLDEAAYAVKVQLLATAPKGAVLETAHVWPDRGELELVATFPSPTPFEPASVVGRIVDRGERIAHAGALRVELESDGLRRVQTYADVDGDRFAVDDLRPGRYRVLVYSAKQRVHTGAWFELSSGEQRDLGAIETVPSGAVRLLVERPSGTGSAVLEGSLYDDPGAGQELALGTASEHLARNLTPGVHRLSVRGERVVTERREVVVEAGATATVTITLRPAVPCTFELELPPGAGTLHVRIADDSGTAFFETSQTGAGAQAIPPHYARGVSLPLGSYVLTAELEDGRAASATFVVASLETPPAVVRLDLR